METPSTLASLQLGTTELASVSSIEKTPAATAGLTSGTPSSRFPAETQPDLSVSVFSRTSIPALCCCFILVALLCAGLPSLLGFSVVDVVECFPFV